MNFDHEKHDPLNLETERAGNGHTQILAGCKPEMGWLRLKSSFADVPPDQGRFGWLIPKTAVQQSARSEVTGVLPNAATGKLAL